MIRLRIMSAEMFPKLQLKVWNVARIKIPILGHSAGMTGASDARERCLANYRVKVIEFK